MAAIVQPLGEPTFEDTHREIRRELEHGLDAMGKEQPGLAETCYAAALERARAIASQGFAPPPQHGFSPPPPPPPAQGFSGGFSAAPPAPTALDPARAAALERARAIAARLGAGGAPPR